MDSTGIDSAVEALLAPIASAVSAIVFYAVPIGDSELPLIVLWLAAAALYFTIYLRFINFRALWLAIRHVRGDFSDPGQRSPPQSGCTAVSGTVWVFWRRRGDQHCARRPSGCWLPAYFPCPPNSWNVLKVKYRRQNADGSVSGGPMYYLEYWFQHKNWPRFGRLMGGFYALALVIAGFGIGNMFQANQAYTQFLVITGGEHSWLNERGWFFGLALATVVALVIIGGIRSIPRVTVLLVPFMAGLYIVSALAVIALSAEHIPAAIAMVLEGAFTSQGATGAHWVRW